MNASIRESRSTTHRLAVGATLVAATLTLAACGSSTPAGTPTPAATGPIATTNNALGTLLVDSAGRTIYTFAMDTSGVSNCVGSCVTYWPPVVAASASPAAPAGVTATLGSLKRADGTLQLTINGLPAYTYAADPGPGATTGQGQNSNGGLWYVFSSAGSAITKAAPSGSASASKSAGGGWA
jgi:predicted lipoprotein with Yx(FWY)xxD motif